MAFKVVVANKIVTTVKGAYTDETGADRKFEFQLEQDRVDQAQLQAAHADQTENAAAFIKRITHGWRGQRLVLNADDTPSEFSQEALDVLLSIAGMGGHCYQSYLKQVLVHEKN